jgi:isocitrate dehydrogenase kinase/phosphatase
MKRCIFFAFCILSIFSCTSTRRISKIEPGRSKITLHEGKWYFNFKTEVFTRCLKKLYPQEFSGMVDSLDGSFAANIEWLDYNRDIERIADSLATSFSKRNEATWTIENRKVTLNVCLGYRNSAELDRFAVLLYKKYHTKIEE